MKHTVLAFAILAAACSGAAVPTTSTATGVSASPDLTALRGVDSNCCTTADGVNDACACDADTHLSCPGFYGADWEASARANGFTTASWKYGLLDCLEKHVVSATCKASLDRRARLNEEMMSGCATYCKGTSPAPGSEPCVDRLKSIYASLDNACRVALDAHEAAKPLKSAGPF